MPLNQLSSMFRAFVVQFRSDSNVSALRLAGKAEHLRTGAAKYFCSLDELLRFVNECMEADHAELQSRSSGDGRRQEEQST